VRYFQLVDDVHVPGRWHIGDVSASSEPVPDLLSKQRLATDIALSAPVSHRGRVLEFCLNSFGVPVAKRTLADVIKAEAGTDVQVVPIIIVGNQQHDGFAIPHCLRSVECLDEAKTDFIKWTSKDHRPELAGQYRMVINLAIDPRKVPPDAHFFRVLGWPVALIVSQAVKEVMEKTGCVGAKFDAAS
jgi:hypothetical protein